MTRRIRGMQPHRQLNHQSPRLEILLGVDVKAMLEEILTAEGGPTAASWIRGRIIAAHRKFKRQEVQDETHMGDRSVDGPT